MIPIRAALTQIFALGYDDIRNSCKREAKLPEKCGIFPKNCVQEMLRVITTLEDILGNDLYLNYFNNYLCSYCFLKSLKGCDENFMMGPLEERARASGYGVFNLRNMLTLWGPGKVKI